MRCADSVGTSQVLVTLSVVAIFGDQRHLSLNLCLYFLCPHPLIYAFFFFSFPSTTECNSASANRKTTSVKLFKGYSFLKIKHPPLPTTTTTTTKSKQNPLTNCWRRDLSPLTVAKHWKSLRFPSPRVIRCVNTSLCWKLYILPLLLDYILLWQDLHRPEEICDTK